MHSSARRAPCAPQRPAFPQRTSRPRTSPAQGRGGRLGTMWAMWASVSTVRWRAAHLAPLDVSAGHTPARPFLGARVGEVHAPVVGPAASEAARLTAHEEADAAWAAVPQLQLLPEPVPPYSTGPLRAAVCDHVEAARDWVVGTDGNHDGFTSTASSTCATARKLDAAAVEGPGDTRGEPTSVADHPRRNRERGWRWLRWRGTIAHGARLKLLTANSARLLQ